MRYNHTRQEAKTLKKEIEFTAKQVGERVKERRTELNLTMPELGRRVGVNKSTIQRYEADGVDQKRTMIINGLADALLTTPEWLTGLSGEKEYDARTLCQKDIEEHIKKYLDTVSSTVRGESRQSIYGRPFRDSDGSREQMKSQWATRKSPLSASDLTAHTNHRVR